MTQRTLAHTTLVMERTYSASPSRVFNAWSDLESRKRWSAPAPHMRIDYEQADFREGGRDVSRCIEPGIEDYVADVRYIDIRRDQRIVFAEEVSHGNRRQAAALISVELTPKGDATHLLLTMQVASFDGTNMEAGYDQGWTAALNNLAKEF